MVKLVCSFVLYIFTTITCVAGSHGLGGLENFEATGASTPWLIGNGPSGFYVSSTNTTWYCWEGYRAVNGTKQRVVEVATKNWTTGAWAGNYIAATNTLVNDLHGTPACVYGPDNHVYIFYGAHASTLRVASTVNADDPSTWQDLTSISGQHTFENTVAIGSNLFLLDSTSGNGTGGEEALSVRVFTASNGVLTQTSQTTMFDSATGANTGFLPLGQIFAVGTKIHFVFNYNVTIAAALQNVYYAIYDTTNGTVSNYAGDFNVVSGSQPISLTNLDAHFKIYSSSYVSLPAVSVNGTVSHVVFGEGPTTTLLQHISADNGGAWAAAHTIYTYPASLSVDAMNVNGGIVNKAAGAIDVYFGDGTAHTIFGGTVTSAGNLRVASRTSGGAWTGAALFNSAQGVDMPLAILNANASARVMFTEIVSDSISTNGILKGYSYSDTAGFALRLPSVLFDGAHTASEVQLRSAHLAAYALTTNHNGAVSRATASAATGKFYFEVKVDTIVANSMAVGLVNAAQPTNNRSLGDAGNNSIGYTASGGVYLNNVQAHTIDSYTQPDTICVAVDLTAKLVWFRRNGANWNNSGSADPATGVGGFDISAIVGSVYPAVDLQDAGQQFTADFGYTGYRFVAPSGYLNWNFLLKRDMPGAANDNSPMWLDAAA